MAEEFHAKGALFDCYEHYPYFEYDLKILVREGYVKITSPESCQWLKSKTSLAEYLLWAKGGTFCVPGGFWAPAEKAFGIKRYSLRRLAGNNGNPCKPDESKDFKKLKPKLQPIRNMEKIITNEYRVFNNVKKLILFAKDEEYETIHEILEKISVLFNKNVDKKVLIRR